MRKGVPGPAGGGWTADPGDCGLALALGGLAGSLGSSSGSLRGGDALLGQSVSGLLVGDLRHDDHRARAVRAMARTSAANASRLSANALAWSGLM